MRAAFSAKIKWLTEEYAKNIFLRPAFPSHLHSSLSLHKILIKIFVFDKYCWLHALVRAVLLKNKNKTKQCSFHANWGEMWIRHWKIMLLLTVFSWWRLSVHFCLYFSTVCSSKNEYFPQKNWIYAHAGYTVYTKLKNPLLAETETTKPAIWHDPEPVPSTFHPHNLIPRSSS